MKKLQKQSLIQFALTACFAWLLGASLASAHPYASGITNNAGTIDFILNESAGAVTVTLTNTGAGQGATLTASTGTSTLPSTVGTNKGIQFFSMIQGATTYTNYSITVSKPGTSVISKISTDSNPLVNFFGPRGVAVNLNPTNKNFGRTYVGNSSAGLSVTTFGGVVRSTGRGMYIINADQSDALGRGTNASAAGITFSTATTGTTYSPYRIYVGNDDTLYIADAMTNTCQLWKTDADVTTTAIGVLTGVGLGSEPNGINTNGIIAAGANHGRISSTPLVFGSSGAANLQVYDVDTDYTGGLNHILNYSIGGGSLPSTVTPAILGDTGLDTIFIVVDIAFGGTNFYTSGFRASDTDTYGSVKIFDNTGTTKIWDSYDNSLVSGHDPFVLTEGISVSPDGLFLATIRSDGSNCVVNLTNGIPDLSTLRTNALNGSTTARSICWDAADNFYLVSGGSDLLRVFSLGLSTVAITGGDTTGTGGNNHGTFQLLIPQTSVSVSATTPLASQNFGNPIPGVFTFTRSGQNLNLPLTVNFAVGGTAANGADYTFSPVVTTNIIFAANQTTTNLSVIPVEDNIPRLTNTVTVTVQNSTNYSLGGQMSDTVYIQNTGPQLLKATAVVAASAYKPFSNDYASFTITRYGDVSQSYTVTNFTLGGTAVVGVDFAPPTVTLNSGDATETVGVFPLVTSTAHTGNKTVTIGVGADPTAGPGYTGSTNTVSLVIIDNAEPPATVLYSDTLNDAADSNNWTLRFASTNDPSNFSPQDYDVEFGFSLANDGVGLPPNGSSTALKVTCNKNLGASAGVNLYPNGQSFTGDYAVRFNLNLVQGNSTATSTEGALFGINHSGLATNWWGGDISSNTFHGPWAADGIWWWISADPGGAGAGDYLEYTGTNNTYPNTGWTRLAALSRTAFPNAFKNVTLPPALSPPYSTVGTVGVPANHAASGEETTWSDVEMKQVKNVVTLSINKTALTVYTNTTMWTNGQIMLGYNDPFASIGLGGAAYYSNLRVVRLGPPSITAVGASGGNVNITFTSIDGDDTPSSFVVQSSTAAVGTYADVSPAATITQSGQVFHATVPQNGRVQFYRIRHK